MRKWLLKTSSVHRLIFRTPNNAVTAFPCPVGKEEKRKTRRRKVKVVMDEWGEKLCRLVREK